MAYVANCDFLWYKQGQKIASADLVHVNLWIKDGLVIDNTPTETLEKPVEVVHHVEVVRNDLNGDGVVDSKDKSLAAKFLAKGKRK